MPMAAIVFTHQNRPLKYALAQCVHETRLVSRLLEGREKEEEAGAEEASSATEWRAQRPVMEERVEG